MCHKLCLPHSLCKNSRPKDTHFLLFIVVHNFCVPLAFPLCQSIIITNTPPQLTLAMTQKGGPDWMKQDGSLLMLPTPWRWQSWWSRGLKTLLMRRPKIEHCIIEFVISQINASINTMDIEELNHLGEKYLTKIITSEEIEAEMGREGKSN